MPDLIGWRFDSGRPDVAWVGDITYMPTGDGWLYLASVPLPRPGQRPPAIFAWINRYNHTRLHSSLGYLSPVEWENHYRQTEADLAA